MWAVLGLWMLLARVSVSVTPRMVTTTVRITCSVPRHPDNRKLTIGIPDYQSSERQLDGEDALITHTLTLKRPPCDVPSVAFCDLEDNLGKHGIVSTPFVNANCSQRDE